MLSIEKVQDKPLGEVWVVRFENRGVAGQIYPSHEGHVFHPFQYQDLNADGLRQIARKLKKLNDERGKKKMSKLVVQSVVRHEEMIEALDRISSNVDFDPRSWSEHEADRLFEVAGRIRRLVVGYYRMKSQQERPTESSTL